VTSLLLLLACSSNTAESPTATPPSPPVDPTPAAAAEAPPEAEPAQAAEPEPTEAALETPPTDEPEAPAKATSMPAPAGHSEHAEQKAAAEEAPDAEPEPATDPTPATEEPAAEEPTATEEPPAPEPEPAGPVTYTLDTGSSRLVVLVYKDPDTMGAGLSHDHVIQARGWTGSVTWDEADTAACKVRFTVPVAKLDVDNPSLRKAYGLEGELSSGQRGDVKDNMLAKDQLNASKYPDISFQSTSCSGSGTKATVDGTLTIHGTGKAISVPMTVGVDGETFTASGSFKANHSDFGMAPFSAMFGQLKNRNQMTFKLKVQGTAK